MIRVPVPGIGELGDVSLGELPEAIRAIEHGPARRVKVGVRGPASDPAINVGAIDGLVIAGGEVEYGLSVFGAERHLLAFSSKCPRGSLRGSRLNDSRWKDRGG